MVVLYKANAIVERPVEADREVHGRWWRIGKRIVVADGNVSGKVVEECQKHKTKIMQATNSNMQVKTWNNCIVRCLSWM